MFMFNLRGLENGKFIVCALGRYYRELNVNMKLSFRVLTDGKEARKKGNNLHIFIDNCENAFSDNFVRRQPTHQTERRLFIFFSFFLHIAFLCVLVYACVYVSGQIKDERNYFYWWYFVVLFLSPPLISLSLFVCFFFFFFLGSSCSAKKKECALHGKRDRVRDKVSEREREKRTRVW